MWQQAWDHVMRRVARAEAKALVGGKTYLHDVFFAPLQEHFFQCLDSNHDGELTQGELMLGWHQAFGRKISKAEAADLFTKLNVDGMGNISWPEFEAVALDESCETLFYPSAESL